MTAMAKRGYDSEVHRRQKSKNFALLIALASFVVLIYLVSIVRIGGG
jgi:hypothetical protein